jgi:hypothetical protein
MPHGTLDVDDRGRTKEALFTAVRLLGHGGVHTHDSRHRRGTPRILGYVFAHNTTNFAMWIVGIAIIKLALSVRLLPDGSRDYGVANERAGCDLLVEELKEREVVAKVSS